MPNKPGWTTSLTIAGQYGVTSWIHAFLSVYKFLSKDIISELKCVLLSNHVSYAKKVAYQGRRVVVLYVHGCVTVLIHK